MADPKNEPEVQPEGISEDDLRSLVGEVVEEKLTAIGDGIGGLADAIVEKLTASGSTAEEGLLEKIGGLIDEKLKGISTGASVRKPHEPKLRVFG